MPLDEDVRPRLTAARRRAVDLSVAFAGINSAGGALAAERRRVRPGQSALGRRDEGPARRAGWILITVPFGL